MSLKDIKVIGFDADDTLWINETYFREAEECFFDLLEDYLPRHSIARELLSTEITNLPIYGYGIKAFVIGRDSIEDRWQNIANRSNFKDCRNR